MLLLRYVLSEELLFTSLLPEEEERVEEDELLRTVEEEPEDLELLDELPDEFTEVFDELRLDEEELPFPVLL